MDPNLSSNGISNFFDTIARDLGAVFQVPGGTIAVGNPALVQAQQNTGFIILIAVAIWLFFLRPRRA